jgi:ABC-type sugar transport system ATPase subunit
MGGEGGQEVGGEGKGRRCWVDGERKAEGRGATVARRGSTAATAAVSTEGTDRDQTDRWMTGRTGRQRTTRTRTRTRTYQRVGLRSGQHWG